MMNTIDMLLNPCKIAVNANLTRMKLAADQLIATFGHTENGTSLV